MKLQWLNLPKLSVKSLEAAANSMLSLEYNDDTGIGFVIKETRRSHIHGAFIEKVVFNERVEDPFGNETFYERIEFRKVPFRITIKAPQLEVQVPSKGISIFVSQLSRAFGMSLRMDPIEWDPVDAYAVLKEEIENATITTVRITDIELSKTVSAKCVIKGTTDVQEYVEKIAKGKKKRIESVRVTIGDGSDRVSCDIKREGSVVFLGQSLDQIGDSIRKMTSKLQTSGE